ncbi:hypothetical protein K2173_023099 [Erythroxylum novogranatense]|uniref:Uncharacterized protein n=1 Tax=Erythroxylum novogranatense TaxID=1862640 RepID=A0AAV8T895_9ROSI|nr:hypothetical protein K2173_023099 [Erythroxylum novogranatense]
MLCGVGVGMPFCVRTNLKQQSKRSHSDHFVSCNFPVLSSGSASFRWLDSLHEFGCLFFDDLLHQCAFNPHSCNLLVVGV